MPPVFKTGWLGQPAAALRRPFGYIPAGFRKHCVLPSLHISIDQRTGRGAPARRQSRYWGGSL